MFEIKEGKKTVEMAELAFSGKKEDWYLALPAATGIWLAEILHEISLPAKEPMAFSQFQKRYVAANLPDLAVWMQTPEWVQLQEKGLLVV